MEQSNRPSLSFYLIISAVLFVAGWGGLALVIFLTLPTLAPRWLFFFLEVIAVTGTALPGVYFINRRFPSNPPVDPGIIMRQSVWFGIYASLASWLQMGRMLSGGVAGIVALVIIIVEVLLRMRETARWQPKGPLET